MSEGEFREVSKIRQELRERLMAEKLDGVSEILACLQRLAEKDVRADLKNEVERWRVRFELMGRLYSLAATAP
jgi:hypothetical protein